MADMTHEEMKALIERLEDFQMDWNENPPPQGSHASRYVELTKDHYVQAATALRQLMAETEWRPIETAPKDGTWILGYAPDWQILTIAHTRLPSRGIRGWYCGDGKFMPATHWLPLPEPPANGEER